MSNDNLTFDLSARQVMLVLLSYFGNGREVIRRVNLKYSVGEKDLPAPGEVTKQFVSDLVKLLDWNFNVCNRGRIVPTDVSHIPLFQHQPNTVVEAFKETTVFRDGVFHFYLDVDWSKLTEAVFPTCMLRNIYLDLESIKVSEGGTLPDYPLESKMQIPDCIPLDKVLFGNLEFMESFTNLLAAYSREYDCLKTRDIPTTRMVEWSYSY